MSVSRYSSVLTVTRGAWSSRLQCFFLSSSSASLATNEPSDPRQLKDEEGEVFHKKGRVFRKEDKRGQGPPNRMTWAMRKEQQLKPDEVNLKSPWSSIWQGPRAFDPFNIPFPIHMGYPLKGEDPPPPVGNLELMKIPNFLHLTPPAIHKHCEALKPLCTPWPNNLPPMPLTVETRNYVFPSHSVKHPGSKQVTIVFKLSDLKLSERARNKMIQLAGSRYKPDKDVIRLYAGRCPTRKQNYEYALYLLKVLYLESNRVEKWELEDDEEEDNW